MRACVRSDARWNKAVTAVITFDPYKMEMPGATKNNDLSAAKLHLGLLVPEASFSRLQSNNARARRCATMRDRIL